MAFLDPLCQSRIWLFFIRFIAFCQEPNSLCALMGRCSSAFSVRKKTLLPDLWPVAISKNSTTGNFRKACSNSSFWNRAVPRRGDHLPSQYVKSKTERYSVLVEGGDVSTGWKTASNRKQHVGMGAAWVHVVWVWLLIHPKTGAQVWDWRHKDFPLLHKSFFVLFFLVVGYFPQGQALSIHPTHGTVLQS